MEKKVFFFFVIFLSFDIFFFTGVEKQSKFVVDSPQTDCFTLVNGGSLTLHKLDMDIISLTTSVFTFSSDGALNISYSTFKYTPETGYMRKTLSNQILTLEGPVVDTSAGKTFFSHVQFQDFKFVSNSVLEISALPTSLSGVSLNLEDVNFTNISSSREVGRYGKNGGYGSCLYLVNEQADSKV